MIKRLTTGWHFIRLFRLAMGIMAIVFGLQQHDALAGFAGSVLLFMAVMNMGCCGASGCRVSHTQQEEKPGSERSGSISYEEVT